MSTITTINGSDVISTSRTTINTNFSNLNTDKIETSVLDTDTTLAANSDSKVATQKAVKTYVDAGGNVNASTTAKGIVEEATQAEVDAQTAAGATGARLFINPSTTPIKASTTVMGAVEEATSAEMIAATAAGATGARLFLNPSLVAETGNDKIVKTKSTGKLDVSIMGNVFNCGVTTKDISSSTTTTIAHGLGVAPKRVMIVSSGTQYVDGAIGVTGWTHAIYSNSTQAALHNFLGATLYTGSGFRIFSTIGATDRYTTGTITVDATNISIAWSLTNSPTGTADLMWEAEA